MNFENLLDILKIKKNDKIIISSNIVKILIEFKKKKINFDPNNLINTIKKRIGKNGTLFIPTFNYDFFKGKTFDYKKSPSQSGALGNIALKRNDFLRTCNPVYSFAVTGKDKKKICNIKHDDCFSLNSPFGYLLKNKGKNIFIDLNYRLITDTTYGGFTFHHVIEQAVNVPYRYFKEFKGHYINRYKTKKKIKIKFYARNLKLKYSVFLSKKLDKELKKRNFLKRVKFEGIKVDLIDLYRTFKLLSNDLKKDRKYFFKKY